MTNDINIPSRVNLKRKSGILELFWKNGDCIRIPGNELRKYCACSGCRARNVVGTLLINESPTVENLTLVGSTGIQLTFADGHDRGIFPWAYLRAIHEGRAMELVREQ